MNENQPGQPVAQPPASSPPPVNPPAKSGKSVWVWVVIVLAVLLGVYYMLYS